MSRPVLGVVSIFALVAVGQDFLWPLMVCSDTDKQPIGIDLGVSRRLTACYRRPPGR